jgi:hypothetical protein
MAAYEGDDAVRRAAFEGLYVHEIKGCAVGIGDGVDDRLFFMGVVRLHFHTSPLEHRIQLNYTIAKGIWIVFM